MSCFELHGNSPPCQDLHILSVGSKSCQHFLHSQSSMQMKDSCWESSRFTAVLVQIRKALTHALKHCWSQGHPAACSHTPKQSRGTPFFFHWNKKACRILIKARWKLPKWAACYCNKSDGKIIKYKTWGQKVDGKKTGTEGLHEQARVAGHRACPQHLKNRLCFQDTS